MIAMTPAQFAERARDHTANLSGDPPIDMVLEIALLRCCLRSIGYGEGLDLLKRQIDEEAHG